jgi:GNAT superfamily N-acetyltransferase
MGRKRAWLRRVLSEWGNCGKILFSHGEPVGYAQYAPARTTEYPAGPVSGDAVFLACLFISAEEQRRRGSGSALLCAILKELRVRGLGAVETFARRGNPENPFGPV